MRNRTCASSVIGYISDRDRSSSHAVTSAATNDHFVRFNYTRVFDTCDTQMQPWLKVSVMIRGILAKGFMPRCNTGKVKAPGESGVCGAAGWYCWRRI